MSQSALARAVNRPVPSATPVSLIDELNDAVAVGDVQRRLRIMVRISDMFAVGSRNYSGIRDPVVDALVDRVIFASDRDDLVAATHALDRVLLWNYYVVPQFTRPDVWLAYWNKFGIPDKQPTYYGPDIESWWIDPDKEKALAAKYKG